MRIRKAVLPVAGLGTRVLPASKVVPKELLPLVDKPTLQYIVEEAVAAGIEEIIFVTSRSKRGVEDHFDMFPELEQALERKGKKKELEALRHVQTMAKYASVRQQEPRGLGHAVLCARELIGDEPFVVILGDDLIDPETPCLPRMMEIHEQHGGSVLCLAPLPPEMIPAYGIASVEELGADVLKVNHLVEKPSLEEAPSNLGIAGHYIITPDIFELIERTPAGKGGEIQITDALAMQAQEGHCFGLRFTGQRYDTGNPLGLLTTSIAYALKRPELAPALREYMQQVLKQEQ
jgi:UTP--glucose-1-phosphate uridylyltransferase